MARRPRLASGPNRLIVAHEKPAPDESDAGNTMNAAHSVHTYEKIYRFMIGSFALWHSADSEAETVCTH